MNRDVDRAAQVIWDYHLMNHQLVKADIIWALGSHDLRVADRAAELWHQGFAPVIVMSGGLGNFTDGVFNQPEADLFAERARELGVPQSAIMIESQSTNTGENVALTRALIDSKSMVVSSAIAVQKPYMERRAYATIRAQWPELTIQVTSPQLALAEYYTDDIPKDQVIAIMVGNLQRIIEYPKRGFMTPQNIPRNVLDCMHLLLAQGYDSHSLK